MYVTCKWACNPHGLYLHIGSNVIADDLGLLYTNEEALSPMHSGLIYLQHGSPATSEMSHNVSH